MHSRIAQTIVKKKAGRNGSERSLRESLRNMRDSTLHRGACFGEQGCGFGVIYFDSGRDQQLKRFVKDARNQSAVE
jgi:hypothetical protein